MVSEEAIRQRSYEIWRREGCPEGRDVENWLSAKAELEQEEKRSKHAFRAAEPSRAYEYRTVLYRFEEWQRTVQPKPRISTPPQVVMAARISPGERSAAA